MVFKKLSEWMDEKNSAYYKSANTKIYSDFSTYAQGEKGVLVRANAKAFYEFAAAHPKKTYSVLEIGVGNGAFASGFLGGISRLDKENKTKVLDAISYSMADFSKNMLDNAVKNVKNSKNAHAASISSFLLDASSLLGASSFPDAANQLGTFDLIRCNELFSDLPADLYSNSVGKLSEILLDEKMKPKSIPVSPSKLGDFEKKFLFAMPEGYFMPISKPAANALSFLSGCLKEGGYIDVFDYGFYFKSDFDIPPEMWNLAMVREFGGQWTVDLNFLYISALLSSQGKKVGVERQKEYVEKIFGKKASLSEGDELDYSLREGEFEEDDSFFHMQIKG